LYFGAHKSAVVLTQVQVGVNGGFPQSREKSRFQGSEETGVRMPSPSRASQIEEKEGKKMEGEAGR
jgi:hypothetical protein